MAERTGAGGDAAEPEVLRALQARLDRATRAAEALLADAAEARTATGEPADGAGPAVDDEVPAAGWQAPGESPQTGAGFAGGWIEAEDARRMLVVLAAVLERIPLELQHRIVAAVREVLLALRALVDWCLDRAERRRRAPTEVQDIPIL